MTNKRSQSVAVHTGTVCQKQSGPAQIGWAQNTLNMYEQTWLYSGSNGYQYRVSQKTGLLAVRSKDVKYLIR